MFLTRVRPDNANSNAVVPPSLFSLPEQSTAYERFSAWFYLANGGCFVIMKWLSDQGVEDELEEKVCPAFLVTCPHLPAHCRSVVCRVPPAGS